MALMPVSSTVTQNTDTATLATIPFNKPYIVGPETEYVQESFKNLKLSGDGPFTRRCEQFFQAQYGFKKCLLTTSCTDALEMAAILCDLKPGDEVIMPSYTFVSTANAFLLRGAKIIFADAEPGYPNMDISHVERLITPKTRVLVVVHYAGVACDMDAVERLVKQHNLILVEDAAHSIDAHYKNQPLGSFGHLATFSFHETKNIVCGEGGLLVVNDDAFIKRAEILREKGTDRSAFFRGEVDKYNWRDIGSSFLPADYVAAFLWGQLENLRDIQDKRLHVWDRYYEAFSDLAKTGRVQIPSVRDGAIQNAHLFFLVCQSLNERNALMARLKAQQIMTTFHYVPLDESPCYQSLPKELQGPSGSLKQTQRYGECLMRLPLHAHMSDADIDRVCAAVLDFYQQ